MVVVVATVVTHCRCVGWVAALAWLLACCHVCKVVVVGDHLVWHVVIVLLLFSHSVGGGRSLVLIAVVGWQQ